MKLEGTSEEESVVGLAGCDQAKAVGYLSKTVISQRDPGGIGGWGVSEVNPQVGNKLQCIVKCILVRW